MDSQKTEQVVLDTILFMRKRFEQKYKNGIGLYELTYFAEWCGRFASGTPTNHMDEHSLKVFTELQNSGMFKLQYK